MADVKEALRKVLSELESEESGERQSDLERRLTALEERADSGGQVSTAQILAALESASDDELEALEGSVLDKLVRRVEEERERQANEPPANEPPANEPPQEPGRAVRPGRKQGRAYGWTVDDEGQIVPSKIAQVWNEPDEPDEVELPPAGQIEEPAA